MSVAPNLTDKNAPFLFYFKLLQRPKQVFNFECAVFLSSDLVCNFKKCNHHQQPFKICNSNFLITYTWSFWLCFFGWVTLVWVLRRLVWFTARMTLVVFHFRNLFEFAVTVAWDTAVLVLVELLRSKHLNRALHDAEQLLAINLKLCHFFLSVLRPFENQLLNGLRQTRKTIV